MRSTAKAQGKLKTGELFFLPAHFIPQDLTTFYFTQHWNAATDFPPAACFSVSKPDTSREGEVVALLLLRRWHSRVLTSEGDMNSMRKRKRDMTEPHDVYCGSLSCSRWLWPWGQAQHPHCWTGRIICLFWHPWIQHTPVQLSKKKCSN